MLTFESKLLAFNAEQCFHPAPEVGRVDGRWDAAVKRCLAPQRNAPNEALEVRRVEKSRAGRVLLVLLEHGFQHRLMASLQRRQHALQRLTCICNTDMHTIKRCSTYRVAQKLAPFLYALTFPNINRFSKFFHCQNLEKICSNTVTKDPTTPQVCDVSLHYLVKCQCLKSNNWKQDDFCNNTLKEINNRKQRVYCLSYCLK